MTGESSFFRKSFFGGFNRSDVVEYIAGLARERNELEAAKNSAEEQVRALAFEMETLRRDSEQARQSMDEDIERKSSVFAAAGNAFAAFETAFNALCADIETAAQNVYADMKCASEATAKIPPILAGAREQFDSLRASFAEENTKTVI